MKQFWSFAYFKNKLLNYYDNYFVSDVDLLVLFRRTGIKYGSIKNSKYDMTRGEIMYCFFFFCFCLVLLVLYSI